MGYRVTIKCTDVTALGAYLHGSSLPDPQPLANAKTSAGAQPILEPGDYAAQLIAQFARPGTQVECKISGKTGERVCTFNIDDEGKLSGRCAFRLSEAGAVQ